MNFSSTENKMGNTGEYLISILIPNSHNYNMYGDQI